MRVVDITPPLTPFSYLGYYCENAGIPLEMVLEKLPNILETLTDPQFLGLKAWEVCLAFILSIAFEENDWNDNKEDLFYKANKEKVKDCFKHLKSSGLSLVMVGATSALSESRLQHNIHSSKHIVVIRAVRCHWRSTKGCHASAV
ncbi:hypothetical protein Tco_0205269 [Tanacetum coccineum]